MSSEVVSSSSSHGAGLGSGSWRGAMANASGEVVEVASQLVE